MSRVAILLNLMKDTEESVTLQPYIYSELIDDKKGSIFQQMLSFFLLFIYRKKNIKETNETKPNAITNVNGKKLVRFTQTTKKTIY